MSDYKSDIKIELKVKQQKDDGVFYEIRSYGGLSRLDFSMKPLLGKGLRHMEYVCINALQMEKIFREQNPYFRYKLTEGIFDEVFNSNHKHEFKISEKREQIIKEKYFRKSQNRT
jgi:hypothetical protein